MLGFDIYTSSFKIAKAIQVYVSVFAESCTWEPPQCDPPVEIQRRMIMVDGKLPRPTLSQVLATKRKIQATKPMTTQKDDTTTKQQPSPAVQKIEAKCKKESESKYIQLIRRTDNSFLQLI